MQSVNLYLPEYRPQREWLNLQQSAIGFVVFAVLLMGVQINKNYQLRQLNERVAALQLQESTTKQQTELLKNKVASGDKQRLQRQAQELRAAIVNRNAIKNIMSGSSLGNQSGFSEHLHALGDKRSQDLVLQRIVLSHGGEYVELKGLANKPSAVPLYVHHLQQTTAFSDAKFGLLTIEEDGAGTRFHLSGSGGDTGARAGQSPQPERRLGK